MKVNKAASVAEISKIRSTVREPRGDLGAQNTRSAYRLCVKAPAQNLPFDAAIFSIMTNRRFTQQTIHAEY
jgi:hypothetical protein